MGDDFMDISAFELDESTRISEWEKWVKRCEYLLGHSLDGCQEEDGYSLDWANDAFDNDEDPIVFVARVRANKRKL